MRNDAFRNTQSTFLAAIAIGAASLLLSSCGGGGAATTQEGGDVHILPQGSGTAYAGIPFPMQVVGGRAPYSLSSSEPSIFPVPALLEGNSFTVLPQQPGVTDVGQTAGEVPSRTVNVDVRDTNGKFASSDGLKVLQNFLVGYGVSYSNSCPSAAGAAGAAAVQIQACQGRESAITMSPTFNGQLRGDALIRFERLRGDFTFTQCGSPPPVVGTQVNAITQNTDHKGVALVCLFVPAGSPTQLASYRIIDVATGVYTDELLIIDGSSSANVLVAVPSAITFTGVNGRCGTGSADFLVFGGVPPYTATSTNGAAAVAPTTSNTNPGRFTVTMAIQGSPCPPPVDIEVVDSQGARDTIVVTSVAGAAAPPIVVAPNSFTLQCGQSGTGVVVGGNGPYNAFSSDARVSASIGGNQVVITRVSPSATLGQPTPLQTTVNITDGTSIATVTVDSPTACP